MHRFVGGLSVVELGGAQPPVAARLTAAMAWSCDSSEENNKLPTDMFGGTPSNLAISIMGAGRMEGEAS